MLVDADGPDVVSKMVTSVLTGPGICAIIDDAH